MPKYTEEFLISVLQDWHKLHNRVPTYNDFRGSKPDATVIERHFDGWNKALISAGFQVNMDYTKVSDNKLIDILKRYYEENGEIPIVSGYKSWRKKGDPSVSTYFYRFGTWINALKLAGFNIDMSSYEVIKGRAAELLVLNQFKKTNAVDLSGRNHQSPFDGICPNDKNYDVKSSKLCKQSYYYDAWKFDLRNTCRDRIDYYFMVGYDNNRVEMLHTWMIPSGVIEKKNALVILQTKSSLLRWLPYEVNGR